MADSYPEDNGVVPEGVAGPEADALLPPYDPFAAWDAKSPAQQLHEILTTFDIKDWVQEPALSVLASFRYRRIEWALIVLTWKERARFAPFKLLEDAVKAWYEDLGAHDPLEGEGDWRGILRCTKAGEPLETLGNCHSALRALEPWASGCWYDEVRDICMVEDRPVDDLLTTEARLMLEQECGIPMRSRHLVPTALTHLCHQRPRDLLKEWLEALDPWDGIPRLTEWLHDVAQAPKTAYGMDIARALIVSLVARALEPGCQYRYVVILEGPENTGKSKLVEMLGGPEWYREISTGLDGKEAHMRVRSAWVAELAELASFSKTEDARLRTFFTLKEDVYIPKYANFEVRHKRRTIFVGTHNPSGDNAYMRDQTGNTRYCPIRVRDVQIADFCQMRDQLFAEALAYWRGHPDDWWQISAQGEVEAREEREDRRQSGVYEEVLERWLALEGRSVVYWDLIATQCLDLPKDRWADRRYQMEVARALYALGWRKGKRERLAGVGLIVPWRKP
jgi:hypothetical protein